MSLTLEQMAKMYKESHDHNERLIKENAELRKKTDPTPADHETWRRETYLKLEEAATANVRTEMERLRGENTRMKELLKKASVFGLMWFKVKRFFGGGK